MSNVLQEDLRPGGQSSSRKAYKKDMMLDEFLERAEPTRLLLHATGKNGGFTGARSIHLTISGTTGDTEAESCEMFLAEDDFYQELSDGSSDYSLHCRNYTNRTAHMWNRRNSCDDGDPGFAENSSWTNSSFLRSDLNPSSPEAFAVETAVRAGCSAKGVETVRELGVGPSDIDAAIDKMVGVQLFMVECMDFDRLDLFSTHFDVTLVTVGDSLLRTYDLLCNINLQLIVMQRELFKHESVFYRLEIVP
uniref:PEROXIDASE_4 domain-containing protein n=1 Tax=Angiostrongylus cantonensis TaxID=6313 RepID=A0A158PCQ8_ANGCA